MMVATKQQYQRAIDKARARGGARLVRETESPFRFIVNGESAAYTVVQAAKDLLCACPAGQREIPCYHAAAVFMLLKGREMAQVQATAHVASIVHAPALAERVRSHGVDVDDDRSMRGLLDRREATR